MVLGSATKKRIINDAMASSIAHVCALILLLHPAAGRGTSILDGALTEAEANAKASCGYLSKFFGRQTMTHMILDSIPIWDTKQVCAADLSGKAFWLPRTFMEAISTNRTLLESYDCLEQVTPDANNWFFLAIEHLSRANVSALIFEKQLELGIVYTDDFGFATDPKYHHTEVVECDIPEAWINLTAPGRAVTVELFLEEFPFRKLFESLWYRFLFRGILPSLYAYSACYGFLLVRTICSSSRRDLYRLQLAINLIICLSCSLTATFMYYGGWYSTGNIDSLIRDSVSVVLGGPPLGVSILLIGNWLEFRKKVQDIKNPEAGVEPSYIRSTLLAFGFFHLLGTLCCTVIIMTKTIKVTSMITPVVIAYLVTQLVTSLIFIYEAHAFTSILATVSTFDGTLFDVDSYEYLRKTRSKIAQLGISLFCLFFCTVWLGTELFLTDTTMWVLTWLCYLMSIWLVSFCVTRLSTPESLRIKRKRRGTSRVSLVPSSTAANYITRLIRSSHPSSVSPAT